MKLNNKGFTLVELLAVIVILVVISSIAIPTISSSLDRSKGKQTDAKKKLLISAAELYVTDHRNSIPTTANCYITTTQLKNEGYIDSDATLDSSNNTITGCIHYDNNQYNFTNSGCNGTKCIS